MAFSPQGLSPALIPAEQMARLSRWARVAIAARAAMRLTPYSQPGPLRPAVAAREGLLAVDTCSTISALAAIHGRQLAPAVADMAAAAVLAAIEAPNRSPLAPGDHAAMLAGLSIEWSGPDNGPVALDTGSVEAASAAMDDFSALLAAGFQESGREVPMSKDFFSRPLWPAHQEQWEQAVGQWSVVLAPFHLGDFASRYRRLAAGSGIDWQDAQQRAEAWVRVMMRANRPVVAPASPAFQVPSFAPPPMVVQPDAPAQAPAPPPLAIPTLPQNVSPKPFVAPLAENALPIPTLRVDLSPEATDADYSDLEPYASSLASTIDFLETESTFTVALQGAQGSGRSVLAGMLEKLATGKPSARGEQPNLTYWFNAGRWRENPTISASLLRGLAVALDQQRSVVHRHLRRLVWSLQPTVTRALQAGIILACLLIISGVLFGTFLLAPELPPDWAVYRQDLQDVISGAGLQAHLPVVAAVGAALALLALAELFGFTFRTGGALARFVHDPQASMARGEGPEIQEQLRKLIRGAIPRGCRMFIFVEDLDRAGAVRSLEFLKGIDELFQFPELVFILLTDKETFKPQATERHPVEPLLGDESRFIDLQIELPARRPGAVDALDPGKRAKAKSGSKSEKNFWTLLLGPLSRDWRGAGRFSQVVSRTMYVYPPYLIPFMVLAWFFFFIPAWEFITIQRWLYPARCRRFYSSPATQVWLAPLCAIMLAHGAIVFQTLNSFLINRHYVVFYPSMTPLSTWVFAPIDMLCLAVVGFFAAWSAVVARELERRTLAGARRTLRQQIDQRRGEGQKNPAAVGRSLKGTTRVASGEEQLVREALEEAFLVESGQTPLERLQLFLNLTRALA